MATWKISKEGVDQGVVLSAYITSCKHVASYLCTCDKIYIHRLDVSVYSACHVKISICK